MRKLLNYLLSIKDSICESELSKTTQTGKFNLSNSPKILLIYQNENSIFPCAYMNEIEVWTTEGKQSIFIDECLSVITKGSDFFVYCQNDISGAINLDSFNEILEEKPKIISKEALELGQMRRKLKVLFGNG